MFKTFKQQFQQNLTAMLLGQSTLYVTDVSKDELWDTYLNSFPEDVRQEYNCNCCRQFIKNYGNVVALENNQIRTIWNFGTNDNVYDLVAANLHKLVVNSPIRDVFVTKQAKLGTDKNIQSLGQEGMLTKGVSIITWEHLYYELPKTFVDKSSKSEASIMGDRRAVKEVFKRSLEELTPVAVSTLLELIEQGSIYRGTEFKGQITAFQRLQGQYLGLKNHEKDNFCWSQAGTPGSEAVLKIRNTAIGTILEDISLDIDLDVCVTKFERNVMAPSNYKRPNTIVTKKMVEDAEKIIDELGLKNSLGRRFATPEDITVNNVLFVNRDAKVATDVFGQLKEAIPVKAKAYDKVEEVSVNDFITKILPKANGIELLVDNKHIPNFVSIIAPQDKEAPSIFKWDNGFSWSYKDAVADSMKERVKAAGGKVDGVLRYSIQWNEDGKTICDLDAHAIEPNATHIGYNTPYRKDRGGNPRTTMSGQLDVDMINPSGVGVENIVWDDLNKMKEGVYTFSITPFSGVNKGFSAEIEFNGEIHSFSYDRKFTNPINVAKVTLKKGVFFIEPLLPSSSTGAPGKTIWNVETQKFQKVSMIMKSPNHWDGKAVGNEHLFFIIEGVKNDETVRGFFNEFLREELNQNKRVFEALGGKLAVAPADKQLSGLGFSSTQRNEAIVKVDGAFSRTIKVKF